MKKYSIVLLYLTFFNYSNTAQWKTVLLQARQSLQQHLRRHQVLYTQEKANQAALKEILECPVKRKTLVADLEQLKVNLKDLKNKIEKEYPHLKNRI